MRLCWCKKQIEKNQTCGHDEPLCEHWHWPHRRWGAALPQGPVGQTTFHDHSVKHLTLPYNTAFWLGGIPQNTSWCKYEWKKMVRFVIVKCTVHACTITVLGAATPAISPHLEHWLIKEYHKERCLKNEYQGCKGKTKSNTKFRARLHCILWVCVIIVH